MYVDPEHYIGAVESMNGIYPANPTRERRGAYEMAYYLTYGELPDYHWVIERVEEVDGSLLWIHFGTDD